MKYVFIFLAIVFSFTLFAQSEDATQLRRHEISTDLSGAFLNNYRIEYNRKGTRKGAFVIGLRMRSEVAGVTLDTNRMLRDYERSLFIPQGQRALDLSVGFKSYIGSRHPQRGIWFQLTALTSLAQWRSQAYEDARAISFFPEEYREPKQMFGLEGNIGYRYVFDNGISLNAFVSWVQLVLRSELISERFTQAQRESGGLDGALTGSFLTLGYVW